MPNKYNPFRPDKLAPPGMFAGRYEEMRTIDHCLLQTKNGNPQHFLIEGERGIGKSSLFLSGQFVAAGKGKTLYGNTNLNFIVVSISLEEKDDQFSIVKKLTSELKNQLSSRNSLKALGLKAWDFLSRFAGAGVKYNRDSPEADQSEILGRFQADLVTLLSGLDAETDGVFILIDEANKAPGSAGLGLICKLLTEELARKGCEKLCIGLAGLPNTIDLLKDSHESSPRLFRIMSLKPLEELETIQVITAAMKEASEKNGFPVSITTGAQDLIETLCEGYPHFLQEFAYCAFEEDSDNTIDEEDVSQSLFRENGVFDQLGRKYFNQYYSAYNSDDYRRLLITMAAHLDDWVSRTTMISESGLKPGTIDNALRALKGTGAVVPHEERAGLYKLPTRSFAVWINASKAAEKVAARVGGSPRLFDGNK